MARYDYVCPHCGHRHVDVVHPIADVDTHHERCSACGSQMKRRTVFSSVRIVDPYGVHSRNPKVQEFFETGDPAVFSSPAE